VTISQGCAWLAQLVIGFTAAFSGLNPGTVAIKDRADYLTGAKPVRIGLASGVQRARVVCESAATATDGAGNVIAQLPAEQALVCQVAPGGMLIEEGAAKQTVTAVQVTPAADRALMTVSSTQAGSSRARYRGRIEVSLSSAGQLIVVDVLSLEDYVAGVVPGEMPGNFPMEALKAQAIIARTYALITLGKHQSEGYDLCSGVHCQVFGGALRGPGNHLEATQATAGQVLTYHGILAETFFHGDCGGSTEYPWYIWWGTIVPYLGRVSDQPGPPLPTMDTDEAVAKYLASEQPVYCVKAPYHRWEVSFTLAQANDYVRRNLPQLLHDANLQPGNLVDFQVGKRSPSGRVQELKVITEKHTYNIQCNEIRWLFGRGYAGPAGLKSILFTLTTERDAQGKATKFTFRGAGWGHGLGLCQHGAAGRARAGQTAKQILQAYYPGTEVSTAK
jgi:stage II sporulation protein D